MHEAIDQLVDEDSHAAVAEKMYLLRQVELFTQLSVEDLRKVAALLETRFYDPADELITEGSLDRDVYFIKSGRVAIQVGANRVSELGRGGVIGELAAVDASPRAASVVAVEVCCAYRLSGERFLSLIEERPDIATALISVLCRRLRSALQ